MYTGADDQNRLTHFEPLSPAFQATGSSFFGLGKLFRSSNNPAEASNRNSSRERSSQNLPTGGSSANLASGSSYHPLSTRNSNGVVFPSSGLSIITPSRQIDDITHEEGRRHRAELYRSDSTGSTTSPSGSDINRDRPTRGSVTSVKSLVRSVPRTRGLSNVTNAISSIFGSQNEMEGTTTASEASNVSGQALLDYNRSDFRQYWMPDSRGKECYECNEKFSTFRRRHHCRICGQIFCAKCCCKEIPGHLLGYMGELRVCNYCCSSVVEYLNVSEENADTVRILDAKWSYPNMENLGPRISGPGSLSATETSGNLSSSMSNSNSNSESVSLSSHGPQLSAPWPPEKGATSRDYEGDRLSPSGTARVGGSLRGSFRNLKRGMSRDGSKEEGPKVPAVLSVQGLAEMEEKGAGEEIESEGSSTATPIEEWEPDWVRSIQTRTERQHSGSDSAGLRPGRLSNAATISNSSSPRRSLSINVATNDDSLEDTLFDDADCGGLSRSLGSIHPVNRDDKSCSVESVCDATTEHAGIQTLFEAQAVRLLQFLLRKDGLDEKLWMGVLWPLTQKIAFSVQPNISSRKDEMDILTYIHVKTLVSRLVPESQVVFGCVCNKSVADSRMKESFIHPEILVIAGSVEYERIGGKFGSIDPIIMQEADHLRNMAHKIAARNPQVVIVEKTVARLAQKFIRRLDMTLVYGLKNQVLKRIARCIQAEVMPTVDAQVVKPRLGTCGSFRTEMVQLLNGDQKSLMFFEECQPDLACTILIFGPNQTELRLIKKMVKFMISVLYSAKLEVAMLRMYHTCVDADKSPSNNPDTQSSMNKCAICRENSASVADVSNLRTEIIDSLDSQETESKFLKELDRAVFSASPFVNIGVPFLETTAGQKCLHANYFKQKQPLYRFKEFGAKDAESQNNEISELTKQADPVTGALLDQKMPLKMKFSVPVTDETIHDFLRTNLTLPLTSDGAKRQIAAFRAHSGKLFRKRFEASSELHKICVANTPQRPKSPKKDYRRRKRQPSGMLDSLSPYYHQRIAVLFCSYSVKSENAPNFCIDPWVVWMEYYGLHDVALGDFLLRYCFNPSYKCPQRVGKTCDVSMLEHTRRIVHRNACVEITSQSIMDLDPQEAHGGPSNSEQVLVWDWCPRCKAATPSDPLSAEMWHLSFAKFLEYLFNGRFLFSHTTGGGQESVCADCLFHTHDHYFAYKNYVANFKVRPVLLYEINFSPMICAVTPANVTVLTLVEDSKGLSEMAGTVFTSMLDQVEMFKTCKETSVGQKYGQILEEIQEIQEMAQERFRDRLSGVQETLTGLSPLSARAILTNDAIYLRAVDGLTRCRQLLATAVYQWNNKVAEYQSMFRKKAGTLSESSSKTGFDRTKSVPAFDVISAQMEYNQTHPTHPSIPSISAWIGEAKEDGSPIQQAQSQKQFTIESPLPAVSDDSGRPSKYALASANQHTTEISSLRTLSNPFDSGYHYTLPTGRFPVVIRDGELSTIIAYALSSMDYEQKRKELRDTTAMEGSPMSLKSSQFDSFRQNSESITGALLSAGAEPSVNSAGPGAMNTDGQSQHIEVQFQDNSTKYYCKIYYAEQFRMLRKLLFADGEDAFVRSLSASDNWQPRGGKSGASFYRTKDKRFILKQMSRFEIQSFLKFAPHYFHYISTAATENKLTALSKIYGVYRIGFKNSATKAEAKMDIFVMEFLFYKKNVKQVYDLKGSLRNRLASEKLQQRPDWVLLDENLLKKAWTSPLYLYPHSKSVFSMAIDNDSHFLAGNHVMDYSLLVGVDEDKGELVLGIIDYIRTYTLDKKLETWVKSVAVPGPLPTVISPELYRERFSEAVEIYFPVAPDQWTGLGQGLPY